MVLWRSSCGACSVLNGMSSSTQTRTRLICSYQGWLAGTGSMEKGLRDHKARDRGKGLT